MVVLDTYGGFFAKGVCVLGALLSLLLLGFQVVRAIRPIATIRRSGWLWGLSAGLAMYGTALSLLGFAGFYNPVSCALLLLPGPLLALRRADDLREMVLGFRQSVGCVKEDYPAVAVAVASVAILLPAYLAPEIFYDALYYHLGLPSQYLISGRIVSFPDVVHSSFPATLDVVFGAALALGGTVAAKWLGGFLFLFALAATAELGRVLANRIEAGGAWRSIAILACVPGVAIMSTMSSVDVGMAFAAAMAWCAVIESRDVPPGEVWRPLLLAAFPLGILVGTKYTGFYLVATLASLGMAVPSSASFRERIGGVVAMVTVALLLASPWYIRNVLERGNPVYPAFPSLFGVDEAGTYALERISRDIPRYGASDLKRLAEDLFSGRLGAGSELGLLIPLAFVALLALGAVRRRWTPVSIASILYLVLWFIGPKATRYLFPVLPLAAAAGGEGLASMASRGRWWRIAAGAILLAAAALNFHRTVEVEKFLYSPKGELGQLISGDISRDEYLHALLPHMSMACWANENLPKEAVILFVGETRLLYFKRPVVFASAYDRPRLARWVSDSRDGAELAIRLRREGITHILINVPELSRIQKGYDYMKLPEKETGKIRELMSRVRFVRSEGGIQLGALP